MGSLAYVCNLRAGFCPDLVNLILGLYLLEEKVSLKFMFFTISYKFYFENI